MIKIRNIRLANEIGLALLTIILFSISAISCAEEIKSSQGLLCESNDDCWDGLPCKDKHCGGPAKADAGSPPETVSEKTKTEASPNARACKRNLGLGGMCKADADCCSGQSCKEFEIPKMGKLKFCTSCKEDKECPEKTMCCVSVGFCAERCL